MKPIHVFYRTCYHSPNQNLPGRDRPEWFDKKACFGNFKRTINYDLAKYTILNDAFFDPNPPIHSETQINIMAGCESKSFTQLLHYVKLLNPDPETIIYFVEDDYVHRQNWCEILIQAFTLPGVHYSTLYDHRDKYHYYPDLTSKLLVSDSCHWRTVPSTTNTYACRYKTLLEDFEIHLKYSENIPDGVSKDNDKFIDLGNRGRVLVSPIPGFSTHCVKDLMSPCIDWEKELHFTTRY